MTVRMTTSTTDKTKPAAEKDFVTRLADAGEEALQRIAELPGVRRRSPRSTTCARGSTTSAKKVRGIDALEERVAKLEKEIAALKKAQAPHRRVASASRRP